MKFLINLMIRRASDKPARGDEVGSDFAARPAPGGAAAAAVVSVLGFGARSPQPDDVIQPGGVLRAVAVPLGGLTAFDAVRLAGLARPARRRARRRRWQSAHAQLEARQGQRFAGRSRAVRESGGTRLPAVPDQPPRGIGAREPGAVGAVPLQLHGAERAAAAGRTRRRHRTRLEGLHGRLHLGLAQGGQGALQGLGHRLLAAPTGQSHFKLLLDISII